MSYVCGMDISPCNAINSMKISSIFLQLFWKVSIFLVAIELIKDLFTYGRKEHVVKVDHGFDVVSAMNGYRYGRDKEKIAEGKK